MSELKVERGHGIRFRYSRDRVGEGRMKIIPVFHMQCMSCSYSFDDIKHIRDING